MKRQLWQLSVRDSSTFLSPKFSKRHCFSLKPFSSVFWPFQKPLLYGEKRPCIFLEKVKLYFLDWKFFSKYIITVEFVKPAWIMMFKIGLIYILLNCGSLSFWKCFNHSSTTGSLKRGKMTHLMGEKTLLNISFFFRTLKPFPSLVFFNIQIEF